MNPTPSLGIPGKTFAGGTLGFLLLALLLSCASPEPPPTAQVVTAPLEPDSGSLLVYCGRLVDGVSDGVRTDVSLWIENGRVREIGADLDVPADVPVLDLSRHTVLPGLLDLHTHLMDSGYDTADLASVYDRTMEESLRLGEENAVTTLFAGFTTVRNVGAYLGWSARDLRDAIDDGELLGPRMQIAGYYLTIPAGGGDLVIPGIPEEQIPAHIRLGVARGPEQFAEAARAAVEGGADVIKVIASGAVLAFGGVPGAPEMTREEIAAVVEVAHAAGIRVAAHAHGAQSIEDAILAGVDTIEHASLIDEERLLLAREHGVALAMDVYNGDYIDTEGRRQGWPEEFLRKNLETVEAQREGFRRGVELGVPIVFATDSAVYPHGLNARQFRIMVEHGMTPMQAIQSATSKAAEAIGWQDRVGALVPGRYGDLVAVAADPLADITALEDIRVVVKGGHLLLDRREP